MTERFGFSKIIIQDHSLKENLYLYRRFGEKVLKMNTVELNINLNFQQLVDAVKKLSPSDKLKLSDAIWDENMNIPAEHKKLVAERMAKSKQKPERMLDWNKASKTLKS